MPRARPGENGPGGFSPELRWRGWYSEILHDLRALTTDDIVISWLAHVRPNVWRLAWPPSEDDRTTWPGLYVVDLAGSWGPEALAAAQAEALHRAYASSFLVPGEPGFYFRPPIGQVARLGAVAFLAQHEPLRRGQGGPPPDEGLRHALGLIRFTLAGISSRKGPTHPTPPPDWPEDPAMWTGSRRRSGVQRASLARALLIRGLVFDGMAHRRAIRNWLGWEIELGGPWVRRPSARQAYQLLIEGDVDALREFEESRAGSDRQVWASLGIALEGDLG